MKAVLLSSFLYNVIDSTNDGVNNIIPYTVLSSPFSSGIGFTDADIRKFLSDAELSERYEDVQNRFDGYIFGCERMYRPVGRATLRGINLRWQLQRGERAGATACF